MNLLSCGHNMSLRAGQVLAKRFKIISPLGAEVSPSIFKAFDLDEEKNIALKVLATRSCSVQKVDKMKQTLAEHSQVNNKHCAKVGELFEEDGYLFYTLELCEGESIFSRLRNEISPKECFLWIEQMSSAIKSFHDKGCILGELRIDKVIIDVNNNIHIMDFETQSPQSKTYSQSSIADLRAPEVHAGAAPSKQSDIYSLGLFIDMLSGCIDPDKLQKEQNKRVKALRFAVSKLSNKSQESRPTIDEALPLINAESVSNTKTKLVLLGSLIIAFVFTFLVLKSGDTIENKSNSTSYVSIVADAQLTQLENVASLLKYPLENIPNVALVSPEQSAKFMQNLALKPGASLRDRRKLAETFNLDHVMVLSSRQTSQTTYMLTAKHFNSNFDETIFEVESRANIRSLNKDLANFALAIVARLEQWSEYQVKGQYPKFLTEAIKVTDRRRTNFTLLRNSHADIPEVAYENALILVESNRINDALEHIKSAKKSFTDSNGYWYLKLDALGATLENEVDLAISIYARLNKMYPDRAALLFQQYELLMQDGQHDLAIKTLRKARALQPQDGDVLLALAKQRLSSGDLQGAIANELSKAQFAYRQRNDREGESETKLITAESYLKVGELKTANRLFEDSLELLSVIEFPAERASILMRIAALESDFGQYSNAIGHIKSAIGIYERTSKLNLQAQAWFELGNIELLNKQTSAAIESLQKSLMIAKTIRDNKLKHKIELKLAHSYYFVGNIKESLSLLNSISSAYDVLDLDLQTAWTVLNSQANLLIGNIDEAQIDVDVISDETIVFDDEILMASAQALFISGRANLALARLDTLINDAIQRNENLSVVRAGLLKSKLCMYIADFVCAEASRVAANKFVDDTMHDEKVIDVWLTTAIGHSNGSRRGLSADLLLDVVNTNHLSVAQELEILIDIQERFDLSFDSKYVKQIDVKLKDEFALLFLDYHLSKASDSGDFRSVQRSYSNYQSYWRYHFILKKMADNQIEVEDVSSAELTWFSKLTSLQESNYKKYYY